MLSMPPATNACASPARMAWAASMTALRPEPYFIDGKRGKIIGEAAIHGGLASRSLSGASRDDIGHGDFIDGVGRDTPRTCNFFYDDTAQLGRRATGKAAGKLAGRRGHASGNAGDDCD